MGGRRRGLAGKYQGYLNYEGGGGEGGGRGARSGERRGKVGVNHPRVHPSPPAALSPHRPAPDPPPPSPRRGKNRGGEASAAPRPPPSEGESDDFRQNLSQEFPPLLPSLPAALWWFARERARQRAARGRREGRREGAGCPAQTPAGAGAGAGAGAARPPPPLLARAEPVLRRQ